MCADSPISGDGDARAPDASAGRVRHVVIAMDASLQNARGIIRGIAAYCRSVPNWSLHVETRVGETTLPGTWLQWADGLIVSGTPEIAESLRSVSLPMVNVMEQGICEVIPTVCADNAGAGAVIAEHLLERGFTRFATFVKPGHPAGVARYEGFRRVLEPGGFSCEESPILPTRREQIAWMTAQTAPVGVMAYHDARARDLLEAAWEAGRRIPEEVAVVGIDNDPLYCDLGHITMSSVAHPLFEIGVEAARTLDVWMEAGGGEVHRPPAKRRVGTPTLIVRESSNVWLSAQPNVRSALQYIQRNLDRSFGVAQVANAVGLSRQQLARLFRAELGQTVSGVIARTRMERARQLLIAEDRPIAEIAANCGFESPSYFAAVFRRSAGLLPSEFRERNTHRGN